jgi:hypothetical protein
MPTLSNNLRDLLKAGRWIGQVGFDGTLTYHVVYPCGITNTVMHVYNTADSLLKSWCTSVW